jgi:hypothetical protein
MLTYTKIVINVTIVVAKFRIINYITDHKQNIFMWFFYIYSGGRVS